jgi:DNA-binding response OmpR family regulator
VSKQSLLLVDGDPRSLRVLEVSLKKAGFNVTTAVNGRDALEKVGLAPPDLVIAETQLEEIDGFAFCQRLKSNPAWADIPFVFLTAQTEVATKIRGLELGVDDYLTKPIYIKEIVARARILLQKRQRARIEERRDGRTRFAGHLSDMPIVDLIQTVEISRKTGLIQFIGEGGKQAAIYFRDGKVIDAEAGPLQAEDAVYRLLTWNEGEFEVVFRTVRRRDAITVSPQALLMEGMRRLDEWGRLCEQLPSLETRFEVDARELAGRLGEIQDEHNAILRLFDGRRSVLEVIDACDYGDLESLEVIARLYFEGVLIESTLSKPTMSGEWVVPAAAGEPAVKPATSSGGLVDEDDEDDEGDGQVARAAARTISDEWSTSGADDGHDADETVPGKAEPGEAVQAAPPAMPRSLSPSTARGDVPAVPSLPSAAAPRRTSLIQKAIDDSDAIAIGELERELARTERPAPPATSAPAAGMSASKSAPSMGGETVGAATGAGATSLADRSLDAAFATEAATAKAGAATAKAGASTAKAGATTAKDAGATIAKGAGAPSGAGVTTVKASADGGGALTQASAVTLPNAVVPDPAAVPAGRARRLSSEPALRRRVASLSQGHATLVTDPTPPARAATGSQRVAVERGDGDADDELVPPNRRGPRWPAVLTGLAVIGGLGYAAMQLRGKRPRSSPLALAGDAGTGLGNGASPVPSATTADAARPSIAIDATPAIVTLDAGSEPMPLDAALAPLPTATDAGAPPQPPLDARAAVDAGRRSPPDSPRPPGPGDELRKRLDTARRLLATDPQQALDLIDAVLDEQRSARALLVRGDALLRLGRPDAALSAVDAALAMSSRSAPAWELKGRALVAAGRREEARPALVRSLDLRPTGPEAEAVRRILDKL